MEAKVNQIVMKLGLVLPLDRSSSVAKEVTFEPALEELPVEVDMELGELGPLEGVIRPLVVDPVRLHLATVLRKEVVRIIKDKAQEVALSSILQ